MLHLLLSDMKHQKALLFYLHSSHTKQKTTKANSDTSAIWLSAKLLITINQFCGINENQQRLRWWLPFRTGHLVCQMSARCAERACGSAFSGGSGLIGSGWFFYSLDVEMGFADWCKRYFRDLTLLQDRENKRGASLSVSNWWNPPKPLVVLVCCPSNNQSHSL